MRFEAPFKKQLPTLVHLSEGEKEGGRRGRRERVKKREREKERERKSAVWRVVCTRGVRFEK